MSKFFDDTMQGLLEAVAIDKGEIPLVEKEDMPAPTLIASEREKELIQEVTKLRKEKNISQLKLALDLSMNQNTISRYETGEREADYKTLIKIADYFNVSIDYLLERTDNPKINK